MLGTSPQSSKRLPAPMGTVFRSSFANRSANRLTQADFSRDARLLDASIAGVVLGINPRDEEMRHKAEHAWGTIRGLLADHLFADESAAPWNSDTSVGSATSGEILKKRYSEIRGLARTVASVSFADGSDLEVSSAGTALCRLAVKLDDLMEDTERRLVNKLRQYVFSSGEETRLSA
jgi:hypothetical protein